MTIYSMYIYNFLFLSILLLLCTIKVIPKKSYIYFSTIYFLIVFGRRWTAGVDFPGYLIRYLEKYKFEWGFTVIQNFLFDNNIDFSVFLFIIYSFTTLTSLWFFRKFIYSNIGIFIFFISEYHAMSINPLRTYIAINIFLIGLYNIEIKGKRKFGFLIMLSGMLFHTLILGAIFVYIVFKKMNILKYRNILDIVLLIIPFFNFKPILYYITSIVLPKYTHYFGGAYDLPLSIMNRLKYFAILILFLYFKKYLFKEDKKENLILYGMYTFQLLMGVAMHFGELHRIAYFYKIFEVIFFVYLIDYKKIGKYAQLVIMIVFIINYIGIIYTDMSYLERYKLRPLKLYMTESYKEYMYEIDEYYDKK